MFCSKTEVESHIKEVHEKQTKQTCSFCSITFSCIDNLNAHLVSVHEGKESKKTQNKNQPNGELILGV
jgi:uncharacterized Zn-finger protein